MKTPSDLQRLREIEAQQEVCVRRLVELKREENEILAKYAQPVPEFMRVSRRGRPPNIPMTEQEKRRRKYYREVAREQYLRKGSE